MSLPPRFRFARMLAISVLLTAIALSGAATAGAEPPLRMDTYVEDPAGALDERQRDQVRNAVNQLTGLK